MVILSCMIDDDNHYDDSIVHGWGWPSWWSPLRQHTWMMMMITLMTKIVSSNVSGIWRWHIPTPYYHDIFPPLVGKGAVGICWVTIITIIQAIKPADIGEVVWEAVSKPERCFWRIKFSVCVFWESLITNFHSHSNVIGGRGILIIAKSTSRCYVKDIYITDIPFSNSALQYELRWTCWSFWE